MCSYYFRLFVYVIWLIRGRMSLNVTVYEGGTVRGERERKVCKGEKRKGGAMEATRRVMM